MTLFLVGFMGSGKTVVGRIVADRRQLPFVDTDALVEERAGTAIERIFRDHGEGRFRELESAALRSLAGRGPLVAATGGGLFLGVAERRFIRSRGVSVWLDVPLEECRRRLGPSAGRPVWRDDDPVALRALYERRRAAYALADRRVPGWPGEPAEVAARVLAAIRGC